MSSNALKTTLRYNGELLTWPWKIKMHPRIIAKCNKRFDYYLYVFLLHVWDVINFYIVLIHIVFPGQRFSRLVPPLSSILKIVIYDFIRLYHYESKIEQSLSLNNLCYNLGVRQREKLLAILLIFFVVFENWMLVGVQVNKCINKRKNTCFILFFVDAIFVVRIIVFSQVLH